MSEFTQYLLVSEPAESVLISARAHHLSVVVVPTTSQWTVVVCAQLDAEAVSAFANCVSYDYAEDHGVGFALYVDGRRRGRISAASEVGHRWKFDASAWIERGLLTAPQATHLAKLLEGEDWNHDDVRDRIARDLGLVVVSWVSWDLVERDWDGFVERFPSATRLTAGAPYAPTQPDETSRLESPDNIRATAQKHETKSTLFAMTAEESRAIAESFRQAAPLVAAPRELVADVDLAGCASSREWLDAKKRIDERAATDGVLAELERTVREGRFVGEGERGAVVREAAAMLLGRCLAHRAIDRALWLEPRRRAATSAVERAAWDLVETVAASRGRSTASH